MKLSATFTKTQNYWRKQMKDRFKTRIFDKTTNTMHYNDFVITSTGYVAKLEPDLEVDHDDFGEPVSIESKDKFIIDQTNLEFDEKMIVMQCTGLKDKNNKWIYEGDIVKDINIPSYFCIVEWIKGGFYLKSTVSNSFLLFDTTQQEVIGNIYENPELLEKYYEN